MAAADATGWMDSACLSCDDTPVVSEGTEASSKDADGNNEDEDAKEDASGASKAVTPLWWWGASGRLVSSASVPCGVPFASMLTQTKERVVFVVVVRKCRDGAHKGSRDRTTLRKNRMSRY
jgi:hypothetical protein